MNGAFHSNNAPIEDLIENELRVTLDAASRYSRNYYAWSHRTWVFTNLIAKSSPQLLTNVSFIFFIAYIWCLFYQFQKMMDDLVVTEKWLECHVSDYSCFQHRQCILGYLFGAESKSQPTSISHSNAIESRTPLNMFWNEFKVLNSLFSLYPQQESLFLHRRFLLNAAKKWCPGQMGQLKQSEVDFFRDQLSPTLRQSSANSWQSELINRYLAYLKRNLNWSFDR